MVNKYVSQIYQQKLENAFNHPLDESAQIQGLHTYVYYFFIKKYGL